MFDPSHRDNRRRFVGGVPPGAPREVSDLRDAIDALIADCQAGDGPAIELCDDLGADELQPKSQRAVFSIVQELLLKICRHGGCPRVLVGLVREQDWIYVEVQAWGIGFGFAESRPNRPGLNGFRRRVKSLGGTATIQSEAGNGTCITVALPLADGAGMKQAESDEGSESPGPH